MTHGQPKEIKVGDMQVDFTGVAGAEVVVSAQGECECCGSPAEVRITMSRDAFRELGLRTATALAR